jgi:hypothetical protein
MRKLIIYRGLQRKIAARAGVKIHVLQHLSKAPKNRTEFPLRSWWEIFLE